MASPPVLDVQALIAPIPGDNPAGRDISFDTEISEKFATYRKEENPEDYRADDPLRPKVAKRADWPATDRLAREILAGTSKDLKSAVRLTEAVTRLHGFAGLRDGLRLLRGLLDQCWDRLNPPLEDGDLEVRTGPFRWLDDAETGARFPYTVLSTPLWSGTGTACSYLDWEGKGKVTRDQFEKAVAAATLAECQVVAEDIDVCCAELEQLNKSLGTRVGPVAPPLTTLREALQKCRQVANVILKKKAPPPATTNAAPASADGKVTAAAPVPTRDAVLEQLSRAAEELRRLEPHSPIPYLVLRAVELGRLPFPDLIKELVRDGNILKELNREFGIKEQTAKK